MSPLMDLPTNVVFFHATAQGSQWLEVSRSPAPLRPARFRAEQLTLHPHSRQKLKQYVKTNNNITLSQNMFDSVFNKALKSGVEKGVFQQPKGTPTPPAPPPPSLDTVTVELTHPLHRPLGRHQAREEDDGRQARRR